MDKKRYVLITMILSAAAAAGIFLCKKRGLKMEKDKRNVTIVKDADGNNIVVINDIVFKGKRRIDWDDVIYRFKIYEEA